MDLAFWSCAAPRVATAYYSDPCTTPFLCPKGATCCYQDGVGGSLHAGAVGAGWWDRPIASYSNTSVLCLRWKSQRAVLIQQLESLGMATKEQKGGSVVFTPVASGLEATIDPGIVVQSILDPRKTRKLEELTVPVRLGPQVIARAACQPSMQCAVGGPGGFPPAQKKQRPSPLPPSLFRPSSLAPLSFSLSPSLLLLPFPWLLFSRTLLTRQADPPYPAGGPPLPGRRTPLTRQAAGVKHRNDPVVAADSRCILLSYSDGFFEHMRLR